MWDTNALSVHSPDIQVISLNGTNLISEAKTIKLELLLY